MAAAAMVEGTVLALVGGEEPAGRGGATSRRRSIALALTFALGASTAGAALGLLAHPSPQPQQAEALVFGAAAAKEVARRAEERARAAESELARAKARIEQLSAPSAADQENKDFEEAQRRGVGRFMKDSTALWGDDRRRVMTTIVRESRKNGLDPALVAAVIHVESRFDPYAVSGVGACGLMQLMPPTAQWLLDKNEDLDVELKLRRAHLFNPILNIELGTQYLAQLIQRFDGDVEQALIAYNAGPGVARQLRHGSRAYRRLSQYPKAVLAAYHELQTPPQQVASR